ncbi:OsmC family protein [Methyloligella sp. 2.7D]|uniref:OsmC family protein n=1 Tax=unclassified Methyloligella TaxID=2625955 RepID=UPI00157D02B5|nr:OsmC family protein [Methyloligella sp. GL2]QKP76623.1 OsmC family protein [Methyloligella sp. GL2]
MSKTNIKLNSAWDGGFKGKGQIAGEKFEVEIGIPADLGGSGAGANPKELFTSATAACFLATLRAITENKKVPVETLSVTTEAVADDKSFSIRHTAHVTLKAGSSEADQMAGEAAIASADKVCVVGNLARKADVDIEVVPAVAIAAA